MNLFFVMFHDFGLNAGFGRMVENGEEYVIQWDAHAKHVTERFSGLFAKQALVDVTLICDDQKLRVHKLVLASCSLYFEVGQAHFLV